MEKEVASQEISLNGFSLKISNSRRKNCSRGLVKLEGELSLNNIQLLTRSLFDWMEKYEELVLKLENVRKIDTGFLQFLGRFKMAHSKKISLRAENEELIVESLVVTGFAPLFLFN